MGAGFGLTDDWGYGGGYGSALDPTFGQIPPVQSAVASQLAQYTPAQLAAAKANGMMMSNGLPSVPPSALNVNSRGAVYSSSLKNQPQSQINAVNNSMAAIKNGGWGSPPPTSGDGTTTDQTVGQPTTTPGVAPTFDPKANNSEQILRYWMGKAGMNQNAQAAALSNLWYESGGLNPTAQNPGSSAHGFAQWTGTRRYGQDGLNAFAQQQGSSPDDPNIQGQFMVHELQTKFPGLIDTLNNQSATQGAETWLRKYEGINEQNSQTAGAPWAKMLSTHVGNADAFFNGKSPSMANTANYSPSSINGTTKMADAGGSDTSVDTNGLPGLSNLRQLAANAMINPANINPQNGAMLQQLMQNPNVAAMLAGNGNTSGTLARMAAGFLGGRGPAASLAGGFGGLAAGQQADQQTRATLLSTLLNGQNDLAKLAVTNNLGVNKALLEHGMNMPNQIMTEAGQLTRNGNMGMGDAQNIIRKNYGLPPLSDADTQSYNKMTQASKALSPAGQKVEDSIIQASQSAKNVANQTGNYANQIYAGDNGQGFSLQPQDTAQYWADNKIGRSTPGSNNYTAFKSGLASLAQETMNAQKGPGSDARLATALNSVQGSGLTNNTTGYQHMMKIGATAELAARRNLQLINNNRSMENKQPMTQAEFDTQVGTSNPDSPFANMTPAQLQQFAAYGGANGGSAPAAPGTAPSVGNGGGGVGQTASGNKFSY